MELQGKGFYLWKINECEGGNVQAIADVAAQAGLTHILIKIADGKYSYNYDWNRKIDLVPPLVQALRAKGISPWGWHYVRGDEPAAEARKAVERVRALGVDGYVIDAEQEYKGRHAAARQFMTLLRRDLPNTPIALSSYRYPSYHANLPWREFLDKCDLNMPQVYWQGASNPRAQLERCLREFRGLAPVRPIFPTGAAYTEHNWTPKPGEIVEFMEAARANGLAGVNFWEFAAARKLNLWGPIAQFPWQGGPAPAKDIAQRYIDALNTRRPDELIKLYSANAIHVTAARTIQGLDSLRAWYAQLLQQVLPEATFSLTGYSGAGNSRHLTWSAASPKGKVLNGNDTFGLTPEGLIGYHFTFFTVTA